MHASLTEDSSPLLSALLEGSPVLDVLEIRVLDVLDVLDVVKEDEDEDVVLILAPAGGAIAASSFAAVVHSRNSGASELLVDSRALSVVVGASGQIV